MDNSGFSWILGSCEGNNELLGDWDLKEVGSRSNHGDAGDRLRFEWRHCPFPTDEVGLGERSDSLSNKLRIGIDIFSTH